MSTFFVTGGCGFIGSNFIDLLLKKNISVVNLDLLTYAASNHLKNKKNYVLLKGDIRDESKVSFVFKKYNPKYVINFAAESHVDRSIHDPNIFFSTNVLGTLNLLNEIIKNNCKCRFLHVSTDEVFGSLSKKEKSFGYNSSYKPQSPYAASKASSDHVVSSYINTFKIDALIINCSNNFGPYQNKEKLIPLVINQILNNEVIPIYGNGKNVRDWIYTKDNVRLIFKILISKNLNRHQILIGSNNELTNIDLVYKIINLMEKKYKLKNVQKLIKYVPDRPGHDFRYSINNVYIKNKFNFKPTNFEIALNKTIGFYVSFFQSNKDFNYYDYSNFRS